MRSPLRLLADAWRLFSQNAIFLMGIYLIPLILTIFGEVSLETMDRAHHGPVEIFVIAMTVLVIILVSTLGSIALIRGVANPKQRDILKLYKESLSLVLPLLATAVIAGVAVMIGFLLFVIPGIILMVFLAFAYFAVVFEKKWGTEAIAQSYRYVKGHWLSVFVRLLLIMFIALAFSALLGASSWYVGGMPMWGAYHGYGSILGMGLFNLVFVPFSVGYMYLLYTDLKKG